jgi:hypothetical protein
MRLFRKRAITRRSGELRDQLMRDAEFLAARADLIAATPLHRRDELFAFLDRVELGGLHPVKVFGRWDEREPLERYAAIFYDAIRRLGARRDAERQPDVKVNIAIGESSAIGTGQIIRYRDRIVNDTLLFPSDLTADVLGAGIGSVQHLWTTEGLIAFADATIPLHNIEAGPMTPERRRSLDDVITSLRTKGIDVDVPVFGAIRGWTTLVSNPLAPQPTGYGPSAKVST